MLGKFDLEGKVAIVTGGGRGLGKAMALALAEAGCHLTVSARTREQIEQTAEEVRANGRSCLPVTTDIASFEQVERMVEATVSEYGRVDVLLNNAGGMHKGMWKPFFDITPQDWQDGLNINLSGAFYCSQAAARRMADAGGGKIINVASLYGMRGFGSAITYCAAKGGVIQLTRALAMYLAPHNIQVNAIAPGMFPTTEAATEHERRRQEITAKRIPLRRLGVPSELGGLAVFLASEASDYITGEVIVSDGGSYSGGYAPMAEGYASRDQARKRVTEEGYLDDTE
jgi:NAD(P)-dependent dehydrogenase (short-subunit alcohol dehydrogenase family)